MSPQAYPRHLRRRRRAPTGKDFGLWRAFIFIVFVAVVVAAVLIFGHVGD